MRDRLTVGLYCSCLFETNRALTTRNVRGDYTGFSHTVSRARQFGLTLSLRLGRMTAQVKQPDRTIQNTDVVGGAATAAPQKSLGK